MSDIVERLRSYWVCDPALDRYHPAICSEAADEITRLRAREAELQAKVAALTEAAKALLKSPSCKHYRLTSPYKELAAALASNEGGAR